MHKLIILEPQFYSKPDFRKSNICVIEPYLKVVHELTMELDFEIMWVHELSQPKMYQFSDLKVTFELDQS